LKGVVTIFGSSQAKAGETDYEMARELGKALAEAGYTVCNGGYGGIMEASARGAKEAGGRTIGVTTEDFGVPANLWIDEEVRMKKWHKRLFRLIELGDGYVVFDGGTGTLVELFIVWEMSNKKFIKKPIVIFGDQMQNLAKEVRNWSQVISPPNVFTAKTTAETLTLLKKGGSK